MEEEFAIGFYVPGHSTATVEDLEDFLSCLEYAAPQVVTKNVYAKAANAVSSAESDVRYWQSKINFATSRLADLQGENGEKIADRRRLSMKADGVCDCYDEFGRMAYLTADDLRREVNSEIYRLEKKLASAKEALAEKQAELERVRLFLAEEEASICVPVVEEEDDDLDF